MRTGRSRLFVCVLLIAAVIAGAVSVVKENISKEADCAAQLSSHIIRFHVRANSDSDRDQQLKINVKEKVVQYIEPLLKDSCSIDESRDILKKNIPEIKEVALKQLEADGSDDSVDVYFEESYFPAKTYGDVTFPPGEYEAFRIDIGDAQGRNWWCVLYPPLCFVDATYGVLPDESKDQLKNILTEDEYNAITETQCHYRFKYMKFLNWIFE